MSFTTVRYFSHSLQLYDLKLLQHLWFYGNRKEFFLQLVRGSLKWCKGSSSEDLNRDGDISKTLHQTSLQEPFEHDLLFPLLHCIIKAMSQVSVVISQKEKSCNQETFTFSPVAKNLVSKQVRGHMATLFLSKFKFIWVHLFVCLS